MVAGQVHNVFWAVVAVLSMFLLAERLLCSTAAGLLAALFLLLARGFWLYSTQMEAYVPATGSLALLTVLLFLHGRGPTAPIMGLAVSGLLALCILYHQSNVLICLPLAYWLVGERTRRDGKRLWVLGLSGVLVLFAYLLAFLHTDGEGSFVRFCLAYAFLPNPGWGAARNLSVIGVGRLIHSQVRDVITFPWSLRLLVIPGFAAAVAGLVLWHVIRSLRGAELAAERRFLLIWLLTFYAFFLWWFPGEKEFFIVTLFPLILLTALAVKDLLHYREAGRRRRRAAVITLCCAALVLIGLVNASETILPYHRDRGPAFAAASTLAERLPAGCLVIGDFSVLQNLRYYYARERVIETAMPDRYRLDAEECIAADLAFVRPDYSLGGMDGYGNPEGWSNFAAWLLGVSSDFSSKVSSCRKFEGLGDVEGSPYLRLSSTRDPVRDIESVFARLDREVGKSPEGGQPFQVWLKSARPPFNEGSRGNGALQEFRDRLQREAHP
ncbi:MAG: hypothetical protein DMF51_01905 [Acidobacteria bacterium]|nr:MAG: hypothetical protein DMF51_01905 [Acidobacteriota bacterium]